MPHTIDLSGRKALITGGGTGIGRGIALVLANAGAEVILTGRRQDPLDATVKEVTGEGGSAYAKTCDVTKPEDVKELVSFIESELGGLDIVINNAGIYRNATVEEMDHGMWSQMMDINLSGPFYVTQACLPLLKASSNHPTVLFISSTLGQRPIPAGSAYCASKAALDMFAKCLAREVADSGIRVNVVSPGIVQSPIHEGDMTPEQFTEHKAMLDPMQPLGRIGQPNEIGNAVLHLVSSDAAWTTGSIFTVDGGIALAM